MMILTLTLTLNLSYNTVLKPGVSEGIDIRGKEGYQYPG